LIPICSESDMRAERRLRFILFTPLINSGLSP
jgi:hypothetical protein